MEETQLDRILKQDEERQKVGGELPGKSIHWMPEGARIYVVKKSNGVELLGIEYNGRSAVLLADRWLDKAWGTVAKERGFTS